VITCNKCGYKAPEGAFNCPGCGSPLSTRMEGGPGSRMGGQDQAEIPAWLETLRVGERPAAPVSNSTNFSAADLIEDGSLPSWMRAGRSQPSSSSVSDAFNALHPISGANSLVDQSAVPQKGLAAQSLIDEKSLPSWMREGSSSATPATPSTGFEASSLIDSAALPDWMHSLQTAEPSSAKQPSARPAPEVATPDWMRSLQPSQSQQPSASHVQQPSSPMLEAGSFAPSTKGFSARDLVDEKSLPSWMAQQEGGAVLPNTGQPVQPGSLSPSSLIDQSALPDWMTQQNGPSMNPSPSKTMNPASSKAAPQSAGGSAIQPGSLSPSSLIDQSALPAWMTQQNGPSMNPSPDKTMNPASSKAAPQSAGGSAIQPGSLSPSSLIDQSALPAWMQENNNAPSRMPSSSQQSSPVWQASRPAAQQPVQGAVAQNVAGPNGNIAASSFVDNNSLPDWLRSGAGQPSLSPANMSSMPAQPEPSRQGTYSGPPRVENMRVPSRPRGEVNASDGSEVAANVFASVLGVASAAPQLPSAPPQGAQPAYGQHPGQYGPAQSSAQNTPMGMAGQAPAYNNNASGVHQQNQPGYASGNYGVGQINNMANRSNLGVPSPGAMPPQPSYNNAAGQANDQKSSNKKHGLVDTLLGWLLH
jgi:hypothetical protein